MMNMMDTITDTLCEWNNVVLGYGPTTLLPPISASIQRGEFWAILGPNGCGKSTLLKSTLKLIPIISGDILIPENLNVTYVPQRHDFNQAVPVRVIDLMRDGLTSGWSFLKPFGSKQAKQAIEAIMVETQISALAQRQFSSLSEGQKQSVLLARALISKPDLIFLDEPTSALDVGSEHRLMALLNEICERRQIGMVMISHHLSITNQHASHLMLMNRKQQKVISGQRDDVLESTLWQSLFQQTEVAVHI